MRHLSVSFVMEITAAGFHFTYAEGEHFRQRGKDFMAYVITSTCIKDLLCVDVCPTDCIHPKKDEPAFETVSQLYVDPSGCIDCGACVPVCTSDSIQPADDLPADLQPFAAANAAFFN